MRDIESAEPPADGTVERVGGGYVIDVLGPGVAGLNGEAVGKALLQVPLEGVISGVTAAVIACHRAEIRIDAAVLGIAHSGAGAEDRRILGNAELQEGALVAQISEADHPF